MEETKIRPYVKEQLVGVSNLRDSFNADQLKFAKNLVNPDLTDTEFYLFLSFSEKLHLNPYTKEVVAVAYGKDKERRVNTIVTRDGKRIVAERTGELEDIVSEAIYIKTVGEETKRVLPWEGGMLWGAQATVVRKGRHPRTVIVPLAEYDSGMSVWKTKKSTMIKKVAESQALSSAFPELLSGVYEDVEMPEAINATSAPVVTAPALEDGDKPATDAQKQTIKSLGGNVAEEMTKQQAVEQIATLTNSKAK